MVLAVTGWGVREWLLLLYGVVWSAVTIMFASRGLAIVQTWGWWASGPGGLGLIWRIFSPTPPDEGAR